MKKLFILVAFFTIAFNFYGSAQTLKGDPWIFDAYREIYSRQPNAFELNIKNYNNGSWNNYEELKNYIKEYQASLSNQKMVIKTAVINKDKSLAGFFYNGKQIAASVVTHQGGNLIGMDGASLIGNDAGSLVGPDGGTISFKNLPTVRFSSSSSYSLKAGKVIKTSGKGVLVIN
jgi:hypothetical protein